MLALTSQQNNKQLSTAKTISNTTNAKPGLILVNNHFGSKGIYMRNLKCYKACSKTKNSFFAAAYG